MTAIDASDKSLRDCLRSLIERWGARQVAIAVVDELISDTNIQGRGGKRSANRRTPRGQSTAREIIEQMNVSEQRRAALQVLADSFSQKTFLPSIGDARHFLSMWGAATGKFKHRSEALRSVLEVAAEMPDDMLDKIIRKKLIGGPTQLGPLSEAIRSAGEVRERPTGRMTSIEDADSE